VARERAERARQVGERGAESGRGMRRARCGEQSGAGGGERVGREGGAKPPVRSPAKRARCGERAGQEESAQPPVGRPRSGREI
jgi:hypothetical protein